MGTVSPRGLPYPNFPVDSLGCRRRTVDVRGVVVLRDFLVVGGGVVVLRVVEVQPKDVFDTSVDDGTLRFVAACDRLLCGVEMLVAFVAGAGLQISLRMVNIHDMEYVQELQQYDVNPSTGTNS